jgi:hypothetical protein
VQRHRRRLTTRLFRRRQRHELKLHYPQRWLASLPASVRLAGTEEIARRIGSVTARGPFCFKDPRFSYTLDVWRPFVGDAVFVCAFRHPAVTAASIVTECRISRYLSDVAMDDGRALRIWERAYRYILRVHHPRGGDWIFAHYDQLLDGSKLAEIEERLGVRADRGFGDAALRRSTGAGPAVPGRAASLYRRLCELAGHRS